MRDVSTTMIYHKKPKKDINHKKKLGKIHVYTGEGKGKTTAALGLALRGAGHNLNTLVIQFLKGDKDSGEFKVQGLIPNIKIVQFGTSEPVNLNNPSAMDVYYAKEALNYARKIQALDRPDILILDEINPAIHHGLISLEEVLDFLDNKHQWMEVVLTGRDAHPEILNRAHLVTSMYPVKHYYDDNFEARFGIDH